MSSTIGGQLWTHSAFSRPASSCRHLRRAPFGHRHLRQAERTQASRWRHVSTHRQVLQRPFHRGGGARDVHCVMLIGFLGNHGTPYGVTTAVSCHSWRHSLSLLGSMPSGTLKKLASPLRLSPAMVGGLSSTETAACALTVVSIAPPDSSQSRRRHGWLHYALSSDYVLSAHRDNEVQSTMGCWRAKFEDMAIRRSSILPLVHRAVESEQRLAPSVDDAGDTAHPPMCTSTGMSSALTPSFWCSHVRCAACLLSVIGSAPRRLAASVDCVRISAKVVDHALLLEVHDGPGFVVDDVCTPCASSCPQRCSSPGVCRLLGIPAPLADQTRLGTCSKHHPNGAQVALGRHPSSRFDWLVRVANDGRSGVRSGAALATGAGRTFLGRRRHFVRGELAQGLRMPAS